VPCLFPTLGTWRRRPRVTGGLAWTYQAEVMGQRRPLAKFNRHVGEGKQCRRHFEAERVGGFEV
jgi:hypothetical protein